MEYQIRCLKTSGISEPATFRLIGTNFSTRIYSNPGCLYMFMFNYSQTDDGELVFLQGDVSFIKHDRKTPGNPYRRFNIRTLDEFYDFVEARLQYGRYKGQYDSQIELCVQYESVYQRCEIDGLTPAVLNATMTEIENRLNEVVFGSSATKPLFK